jgi:tartrate dehydratase beta subunit/fumarate hydratase class I family protein
MLRKITILAIIVSLVSCSPNKSDLHAPPKGGSFTRNPADTTKRIDTSMVLVAYRLGDSTIKGLRADSLPRIIKDSFAIVKMDTTGDKIVATREWKRDTAYYLPMVTDTVKKQVRWLRLGTEYVQEIKVSTLPKIK